MHLKVTGRCFATRKSCVVKVVQLLHAFACSYKNGRIEIKEKEIRILFVCYIYFMQIAFSELILISCLGENTRETFTEITEGNEYFVISVVIINQDFVVMGNYDVHFFLFLSTVCNPSNSNLCLEIL